MINKIDKSLIKIHSAKTENKIIECIVFLNNMFDIKSRLKDVEIVKYYNFINAVAVKISIKDMYLLSDINEVRYISSQKTVKAQIQKSKTALNLSKFYSENIFGDNINVAVIDTGIEPMLDFVIPTNRIIKFVDFVNGKELPYDDNGHGTFVSGVLLGNGIVSNKKYQGVAPKSNLIALKALDANGEANAVKILDAMQWIYDNRLKYKIKVVCMSFGSQPIERNDPLSIGAEILWRNGVVVVVAGGNSGPDSKTIKSPGINNKIITVGGAKINGYHNFVVPSFSSRGPVGNYDKPDIVAPAVDVISNNNRIIDGKAYTKMSGTSVATPIIAGVAVLILQKYPYMKPNQIKSYIIKHGIKMGYGRSVEGFGIFIA